MCKNSSTRTNHFSKSCFLRVGLCDYILCSFSFADFVALHQRDVNSKNFIFFKGWPLLIASPASRHPNHSNSLVFPFFWPLWHSVRHWKAKNEHKPEIDDISFGFWDQPRVIPIRAIPRFSLFFGLSVILLDIGKRKMKTNLWLMRSRLVSGIIPASRHSNQINSLTFPFFGLSVMVLFIGKRKMNTNLWLTRSRLGFGITKLAWPRVRTSDSKNKFAKVFGLAVDCNSSTKQS